MIVYVAVPLDELHPEAQVRAVVDGIMQMKRIAGSFVAFFPEPNSYTSVNSTAWASYLSQRSLVVSAPPNQLPGISTRTLRSTCSCPGYCLMMSTPNAVISPAGGGLGPLPFGIGRQSHLPSWHEPPASAFQKR